ANLLLTSATNSLDTGASLRVSTKALATATLADGRLSGVAKQSASSKGVRGGQRASDDLCISQRGPASCMPSGQTGDAFVLSYGLRIASTLPLPAATASRARACLSTPAICCSVSPPAPARTIAMAVPIE